MIEDRKLILTESKLFKGERLSPHFKRLIEKESYHHIKSILLEYKGDTWQERVWRYLHNDNEDRYCKAGCGNVVKYKDTFKKGFHDYCSRQCVEVPGFTFSGRKHTKKTREKMVRNHADFRGDKNPFKNSLKDPEKRKKHKERMKELWKGRDEKWREEFARKLSARPPSKSGGGCGRGHKNGRHYSTKIKKGSFWYRSSWELEFALLLDKCDKVFRYEVEQIRIPYYIEGKKRYTYCDFHVFLYNGKEAVIEVKPDAISALKQHKLMEQVKWCLERDIQYGIIDQEIITNSFDELISSIEDGILDPNTFAECEIMDSKQTKTLIQIRELAERALR